MALTFDVGMNERAAVRAAKNLGDELKDVDDKLDDLGDNRSTTKLDAGFDRAKSGVRNFGDEARQTSAEMAASFDGSFESIGDAAQELAAQGLAGLGPAGAVAGTAIAVAMGTAIEAVNKANEALTEARNSTYEFALAAGATETVGDLAARIDDLTGSLEGMKNIQDIATVSGWEQKDVITAMATGNGLPALVEAFNQGANSTSIATIRTLELNGALQGTAEGFATGAAAASVQAQALYDLTMQSGTATGEVDDLGNAIYALPGGKEVVVDAQTHEAHVDLDAVENKNLGEKYVPVRVGVDDSAWRNWRPSAKFATVYAGAGPGIRLDG